MNLLASPWSESIERAAVVIGRRSFRFPFVALAASLLLVVIGNSTIADQVTRSSDNRVMIANELAAIERQLAAAHLRERSLHKDITVVRRIAAIERNDQRMLEAIAAVANTTPKSVWFVALTIDHHRLTVQAKTDSFAAISSMLRSASQQGSTLRPQVSSVLRSTDPFNPILAFTMEIQEKPSASDRGFHDRT